MTGFDRHIFGIASARQQSAHGITNLPAWRLRADLLDHACDFETGDISGRVRRSGVASLTLNQVGAIQPRRLYANQHLCRPQSRLGPLFDVENVRRTWTRNHDGSHGTE
jgi:hypothetical protein